MKRVAVVLSGCGFRDGSEITEAVSSLVALSQFGAEYTVFAPNISFEATDHLTGEATRIRNVLNESARIARGQITDLAQLKADDFDAVVFPGGYGAALHLCDWAKTGAAATVFPEARRVIEEFHSQGKPIAAICIAPALIAKVLGSHNVTLTIGDDKETAQEIEKTGARHVKCAVEDFVTDRENKVISTPAYMYEAQPHQVFNGISRALKELVEMA